MPTKKYLIKLTEEEHKTILNLLDITLNFPMRDRTQGLDGERWILESNLYQKMMFSIWTPLYHTEKRGYANLIQLEGYLRFLEEKYDKLSIKA